MTKLPDLREQRAFKVAEMRGLVEAAEQDGRDLSDGESQRFELLKSEVRETRIAEAETLAELDYSDGAGSDYTPGLW